jgi:putative spermidine/putrescine transport system substrate-binding protein
MKQLKRLIGLTVAGMAITAPVAAKDAIVVGNAGGSIQELLQKVIVDPFTKETDIPVKLVSTANRVSALKGMQATGNVVWDAGELAGNDMVRAGELGLLEEIDYTQVDPGNKLPAMAKHKYGVAFLSYSEVLAVRTDKLPPGKEMKSWADFWDVKTFPGPRTMRNMPEGNVEFALLADGVDKDKIYEVLSTPEGVDRAFKKLDEIKPHIVSWWTTGAQPNQMLTNGDAYYATAFSGRITQLAKEGVPVKHVWNGGTLVPTYMGIPKNAKHPKEAHQFIEYLTTNPERYAKFVEVIPYPGFMPDLEKHLSPEIVAHLPTAPENLAVQFQRDDEFWLKNYDKIFPRWQAWVLKKS